MAEAPSGQQGLAWSHDGSRIAVAEPGQIRVVHVDGGASTLIPLRGGTPASLGWTARDEGIVYIRTDPATVTGAVYVVEADGQSETALMPTPLTGADRAAVSPDGSRVAYVPPCASDGCGRRVLIMDTDGSNVVEVPIPIASNVLVSGLVWSPDYKRLLLSWHDGVTSVPVAPGSPAIVYASGYPNGGLFLEWSGSATWQPVEPAQGTAPAASESPGPGVLADGHTPGTFALSVGSKGYAGPVACQSTGDGQLSIGTYDDESEWFPLVFRSDGTVSSLSGALRGVIWKVTLNPQGTLKADKSGTFSGKDAMSGADVSGTFACN
jgi:hypothetical protein